MLLPETLKFADRNRFIYRYAYFLSWKKDMVPSLEAQDVQVDCIEASNPVSMLLKAREVARELLEWNADVLHCHLPMAGVVGRMAGKLASVPVVYTEHNVFERYHPLTRRASLATWRWQQAVIAVSGEVAESLRRTAPPFIPVKVVLNGVDVDRFNRREVDGEALRTQLGIPGNVPVVGTVAVFRTQKRLDDWLDAARALLDRHPECRFLLVGDGPLRGELEARAESLGMKGSVHWVGLQKDVRPYLVAMDVYMMSSVFEGLPVALLEAMAMRCAVVCTSVGGIPEVIQDRQNGFLVEPMRPEILARVVASLLGAPEELARIGEAARGTVVERFSVERMAKEIESTYLDVFRHHDNGR